MADCLAFLVDDADVVHAHSLRAISLDSLSGQGFADFCRTSIIDVRVQGEVLLIV